MKGLAVEKRFSIALDIKRSTSNRDFEVVEGDNGNILEVTLTDEGEAVALTGCRVCAVFSKSDGHTAQQDTDNHGVTIDSQQSNKLVIDLYNTSFAPGLVECELQVFSGTENQTLVTSAKFNFMCRRGIANSDTVQSTDEWPLLVGLLERVEDTEAELMTLNTQTTTAAAAANTAASAANTAAEEAEAINTTVTAAEALRVAAEQGRASAEQSRVTAEQGRVSAEQGRETGTASAVAAAQAATDRANAAAAAAEEVVAGAIAPHASTHASGGSDPITPASIGAGIAPFAVSATLTAAGWSSGAQTITVTGVTSTSCGDLYSAPTATAAQDEAFSDALLKVTGQAANSITVTCRGMVPSMDLPIEVEVRG